MNDYVKERKRNLTFHILKYIVENPSFNMDEEIATEDLKNKFYFKVYDVLKYSNEFIENNKLKDSVKEKILEYRALHEENRREVNEEVIEDFKKIYTKLVDYFANINNREDLQVLLNRGAILAEKIHWVYLPVFKEVYMSNAEMLPEDNLLEYYHHFHTIEDLFREITNDEKRTQWKSVQGDINLNKKMKMKIYTSRWGHYDAYNVKRTIDGWVFSFNSYQDVKCKTNGELLEYGEDGEETGFYKVLKHDSVQYPKDGVRHALEILWEEADSIEMSTETLQKKLHEISIWISEVEKATHKYQPSWCGYY